MLRTSIQNLVSVRKSFGVNQRWMSAATEYPKIEVTLRSQAKTGSRQSRYLRKDKIVPGVLYGTDNDGNVLKNLIQVSQKEVMKELRVRGASFENTVYEMTVKEEIDEGSEVEAPKTKDVATYLVTPRQTQFSPITEFPVSVNFLRYRPGNRVRIPVVYKNMDMSADIKRGCFLVHVHQFVECVCDGPVPATIVVDLAEAKKGDIFRLTPELLPDKVRPAKTVPLDYVLGVVQSTRG
eukprot:Colp12_sorted_trinity150504_noHs@6058